MLINDLFGKLKDLLVSHKDKSKRDTFIFIYPKAIERIANVFILRHFNLAMDDHCYYNCHHTKNTISDLQASLVYRDQQALTDRQSFMLKEMDELASRIFGLCSEIESEAVRLSEQNEDMSEQAMEALDQLVAMAMYYQRLRSRCLKEGICSCVKK